MRGILPFPTKCIGCGKIVKLDHEFSHIGEHPTCSEHCHENVMACQNDNEEQTVIRYWQLQTAA